MARNVVNFFYFTRVAFLVSLLAPFLFSWAAAKDFDEIQENHMKQRSTFFSFIKHNMCKHIYLDMGTNIGMQLRKVYEPHLFVGARVLPYFNVSFGTGNRQDVCSLGFEPSSLHRERLSTLEMSYQKANFPVVILTNTAVMNYDGQVVFYRQPSTPANRLHNEWGASTVAWAGTAKGLNETAVAVDIDLLVNVIVHLWHASTAFVEGESLLIAKLDIEGGEFTVLPHMLAHGSLCKIDQMLVEWHHRFFHRNPSESVVYADKMVKIATTNTSRCRFHEVKIDDETFGDGIDTRPMPLPVNDSRVMKVVSMMMSAGNRSFHFHHKTSPAHP